MKLSIVETGLFKLDGGAMFGVVPKVLWKKLNPPDDNNMCTWTMRCLLIETGDRKILVDTGLGDKQDEKFRSHFHPHGDDDLVKSIHNLSLEPKEITDVFLTHFHFDHVGGAVSRIDGELVPTFPNATYWSNQSHFDWAYTPNPREKASFLKENFVPLRDQGKLKFIDEEQLINWIPGIDIFFSYGHTEAMMSPIITLESGQRVIYCADVIPSMHHVSMPYIMAYDVRPLNSLDEKKHLLDMALERNDILLFEHDHQNECATLTKNDRGRIVVNESFRLEDFNQGS